jgi:hypothetical protein
MEPQGSFTLSITSASTGKLIAEASLTGKPAGGFHPNPEAACEQLSKVDGRIEDTSEDPGSCTQEFDPVIVAASGTWCGESGTTSKSSPTDASEEKRSITAIVRAYLRMHDFSGECLGLDVPPGTISHMAQAFIARIGVLTLT